MSSAGMSGTSNTERGNPLGGQPGAPGAGTPDDAVEVIEVIEVEEPMLASDAALAEEQEALDRALMGPGFQWWYVPAIGLPVVVGGGAAIWYLTKGPQPFQDAYDLVTRRSRTSQAKRTLRKGARTARASAKNLSDQTEDLRERLADVWDDARDQVLDWWDTMTDRDMLEQIRSRANDAAGTVQGQLAKVAAGIGVAGATAAAKQKASGTRRGGFDVNDWLANLGIVGGSRLTKSQAQDLRDQIKARAAIIQSRARGQLRQAQIKGTLAKVGGKGALATAKAGAPVAAKAAVTKAKTERAAKRTGRRANRAWKSTRAFTFGMLVAATTTYIRTWRARQDEKNLRETAGGRMVRDA